MSAIVVDSRAGGNTQISPAPSRKPSQVSARSHHFFTFNSYDSRDIDILCKLFNEHCHMYVFQEETGETGNKHLQGVISCKKPMRDSAFGYKEIHWEAVRNIKNSYAYCSDPNKRTGQVFSKNFDVPPTIILPKTPWFHLVDNIISTEPDRRTVNWFWSTTGNIGKSWTTSYLVVHKRAVFCSKGKYADIINLIYNSDMLRTKIVVFDLPRNNGNKISYSCLEAIKNGLICNTKFETGYKAFEPPHVLVFANTPPEKELLSEDRWNIVNLDEYY